MRKTIALAIIAIFIFSLVPLAFAEEGSKDDTRTEIKTKEEIKSNVLKARAEMKVKSEEKRKGNIERLKSLKEGQRANIEALESEKLDKISNLNEERLHKIAELDKRQIERLASLNIKNLEKIAELKTERLERISKLNEDKIERLAELDKDKLEKVSDLNETEIEKFSTLNRAELKDMAKLDKERMKAELKALKLVNVKNAGDLDKRKISDSDLVQLREKFDKEKEKFNKAKDNLNDARNKLKGAKDKKDEKATFENARSYLLGTSDALITHLEKIKIKVQESKNIQGDIVSKIVAEIDAQVAEINSIKADVQAATTKEQLKDDAKKLRTKWDRLKHLIRLHAERVVAARVEGVINRGIVLEKKLDNVLAKAKEKGIEVNVSAEISTFSEKIATAKDKYTQAQAKLSSLLDLKAGNATNEQIKATADEANSLLKEARDAIKEAHDILKTIVKKIKEVAPEADLSEDAEVEVAQEIAVAPATGNSSTQAGTNSTASASS